MAGALRTCVTYRNRPNEPVCSSTSTASTTAGHGNAGRACSATRPRSRSPRRGSSCRCPATAVDSVNLKNPRLGVYDQCRRARRRARRAQGPHPPVAGAGGAPCRPDRQRIRNAPDAPRPVGSAAQPAALHVREGGAHARATRARFRPGRSTTRNTTSCASSTSWSMRSVSTSRWSRLCSRARSRCRPRGSCA